MIVTDWIVNGIANQLNQSLEDNDGKEKSDKKNDSSEKNDKEN